MVPQVLVIGANAHACGAARAATEASGWNPIVLSSDESPCLAIERIVPAYVLLDAAHPGATDFALYMVAARCRARVLLFGTTASTLVMRQAALRFGATTVDVPFTEPDFTHAVEHRLDAEEWLAGWLNTRRMVGVSPSAVQLAEGLEL